MKKALIIGYYFQQTVSIGSVRVRGLAKYLRDFGWDITILSGTTGDDEGFDVVEVMVDDVVTKWSKILKLDQGILPNVQMGAPVHRNRKSIYGNLISLGGELCAYPDVNRTWIKPAIARGRELLRNGEYDVIISSSGPFSAHIVAASLASEFNLPWLADLRDLWTQNHNYSYSRIRRFFERRLECRTLSRANALTTVSSPLAKDLGKLHRNQPVISIQNGFDPDMLNPGIPLTDTFSIVYTGNIYREKQNPAPLFRELRLMVDEKIVDPDRIEARFFGLDEDWLRKEAKRFQLDGIVHIHGMVPHRIAIAEQQKAQILLFLAWNDPRERGVYTGKLFEYLAARRPILSVGNTEGGVVKELLDQTRAGVHCSNETELREYLLRAYRQFQDEGGVQYHGIEAEIMKYSHREMAGKFADVLEGMMKEKKQEKP
jgi:hypothetical protein